MNNPVLLFDGVCNLCNGVVRFLLLHEKNQVIKFAALQSDAGKIILDSMGQNIQYNSIVFIENNVVFEKSKAAFKITKYLKFPWSLFAGFSFLPLIITDTVYDFISNNRYRIFGKSENCMLPDKTNKSRFLN